MSDDSRAVKPFRQNLLPPYRAVLVVDVAESGRNPSSVLPRLSVVVPEVLDAAFARSGLDLVWKSRRFPQDTGDGYLVGFEPEFLPRLITPFLPALQDELAERHQLRTLDFRMRMRVSIHVGPLPDSGGTERAPMDGIGKPMTDAHRLLNSQPVTEALKRASPDVTYVAAIISQRVYEDVIEARYTDLHPHQLTKALIKVKEFDSTGWLYLPVLSRDPDQPADPAPPDRREKPTPDSGGARTTMTFHGDVGQAIGQQSGSSRNYFGTDPRREDRD